MKKLIRLKYEIKKNDVISFDIFDTLIKRDVPNPHDVFDLVISKFYDSPLQKNSDFRFLRIKAEDLARKEKNGSEITIGDIYNKIEGFSLSEKEKLMDIECDVEKFVCKANVDLKPFYDFAIKLNKRIVIISDMYLPIRTIKDILSENGFEGYYKLYLSNDAERTKENGSLFELVREDLSSNRILHIGDNFKSDIINAKKNKINTFFIKKDNVKLKYSKKENNRYISNFINNGLTNDYYFNVGYECLGPLLYSFSQGLKMKSLENPKSKIYFLARDGKIMKDAFEIIFPEQRVNYLLASRRSYIIPTLFKYKSVYSFFENTFTSNYITIPYVISKMGLSVDADIEVPDGIDLEKKYKNLSQMLCGHTEKNFILKAFEMAKENSINENELMKEYLDKKRVEQDSIVVDIGWYGNMQNALSSISGYNFIGYYLGVNSESPYIKSQNMNGFLFNHGNNLKRQYQIRTFIGILELMFSRYDEGSFIKFKKEGETVFPVYKDGEFSSASKSFRCLQKIHKGALAFVKDYKNSILSEYINIDANEGSSRIVDFGVSPKFIDVKKFNNIHEKNEKNNEYLNNRNIFYYLTHLKKLNEDFQSSWFSGFAYKLVKIKVPISCIYVKLKIRRKNEKI